MARTRDPAVDDRIHAATVDVLRRDGFERMTVDAVAAVARVGKAAIYRRYASKEDLVVGSVRTVLPVTTPPDDATGADALAVIVEDLRVALFEAGGVGLLPLLLTSSSDADALASLWRREIVGPRIALVDRVLSRTPRTRGADAQLIGELAFGGLIARHIGRGPVTTADAGGLARDLWRVAVMHRPPKEDDDDDDTR